MLKSCSNRVLEGQIKSQFFKKVPQDDKYFSELLKEADRRNLIYNFKALQKEYDERNSRSDNKGS